LWRAKIAEVDSLLTTNVRDVPPFREVHPEVCFWALAGRKPMSYRKGIAAGRNERLRVLTRYDDHAATLLRRALLDTRRADVQADDVLDALVALVTAEAPDSRRQTLAGQPARDERGLPMEMVYVDAKCSNTSPNPAVQGAGGSRCSPSAS
jgi:predicted RNase H-like nuclease